ncbi:alpha/beta hydrolase [Salinarimonas soli]|uniref:Phospholipase n=1 Tax=Salinarimonas soli TaxID=1638099 RepID=A0A5B2V868_9HYPH|nr:alpha/beta hydrolase-fold protein [Salinarimonas soli]KAA2235006.1 phospholipase [Salinarimonas soli]
MGQESGHGPNRDVAATSQGRLSARPQAIAQPGGLPVGLSRLGLEEGRDGLLFVPRGLDPARPAPLVVMLHGAGGEAAHVMGLVEPAAAAQGFVVLSPDSRLGTWDVIRGGYGPDVAFLNRALERVFAGAAIDPGRIAVGGFSDGGSYALCLGLANGDLFSDVLAFSPGFAAPAVTTGRPRIFISHGDRDEVLPVDKCGRRLARVLREGGYDVDYREFGGGHVVPPEMVAGALARFFS